MFKWLFGDRGSLVGNKIDSSTINTGVNPEILVNRIEKLSGESAETKLLLHQAHNEVERLSQALDEKDQALSNFLKLLDEQDVARLRNIAAQTMEKAEYEQASALLDKAEEIDDQALRELQKALEQRQTSKTDNAK